MDRRSERFRLAEERSDHVRYSQSMPNVMRRARVYRDDKVAKPTCCLVYNPLSMSLGEGSPNPSGASSA
jgi:hypothetical protein